MKIKDNRCGCGNRFEPYYATISTEDEMYEAVCPECAGRIVQSAIENGQDIEFIHTYEFEEGATL